jgi:serine protease
MKSRMWPFVMTVVLIAPLMTWCNGGGKNDEEPQLPLPEFSVDPSIQPELTEIPGFEDGTTRPVASLVDEEGYQVDFVENELVLVTDSTDEVNAFCSRRDGEEIYTFSPDEYGMSVTGMHVVRVNTPLADTSTLVEDLRSVEPNGTGQYRVSSEDGLRILATAANEAAGGRTIAINWVGKPAAFRDRVSDEAPSGPRGGAYSQNAFAWPHFRQFGNQDIGVAEAWRILELADKLDNKVEIAVIDQGFSPDDDFPSGWEALSIVPGKEPTGSRNTWGCSGGTPCPWHGTNVVGTAAGIPDNEYGGAGVGGPVAEIYMVFSGYDYISAMVAAAAALFHGADIINMSFSTRVPTIVAWTVYPFEDVTEDIRHNGRLIFAAAGNEGDNVDAEYHCCGISWGEKAWYTPCENNGVVCVGGLDYDSKNRHPDSNYGSEHVDIFAPFVVWVGPDPGHPDNEAREVAGTSFSSPFAAGVAALIWASDPGLSAGQVMDIMYETAHTSLDSKVNRYVNAMDAVVAATGEAYPFIDIVTPPDGTVLTCGHPVFFQAEAMDFEGGLTTVFWGSSLDGLIGLGPTFTTDNLSCGVHTITASAIDAPGNVSEDRIRLTMLNYDPVVRILQPAAGSLFCEGESVSFRGISTDLNAYPDFVLQDSDVVWEADTVGTLGTGHEITHSFTAGTHAITFRGVDDQGRSDEDMIFIEVDPCIDLPPVPAIDYPATDIDCCEAEWQYDGWDAVAEMQYKEVILRGHANDPEDGSLTGSSLVWTTNRTDLQDAVLGTGQYPTVRLYAPGGSSNETHMIALTATDSGGNARSVIRRVAIWGVM